MNESFQGFRNGHYDDQGRWQRTKFCFRSCGHRCDCGPPGNRWYDEKFDKSKKAAVPAGEQS
jgi:hypothetical protein